MCGIFALLNSHNIHGAHYRFIESEFLKGKHRGPEFSKLDQTGMNMVLGFHRLAINGLNIESNQPLIIKNIVLICNGEIYNYKQLYSMMNINNPETGSDCEVIIHLYLKYGIEQTLRMLDGVFAFVLVDKLHNKIYVARDPFGVRPLYSINTNGLIYGFASELKCLEYFYNAFTTIKYVNTIQQFQPGTYSIFTYSDDSLWIPLQQNILYFIPNHSATESINIINNNIAYYLHGAVVKRCITTERPIACLLSGGLDSSLITALVNKYTKNTQLETYSIGLKGSEDLKYAKIVADFLGTNHTEVIVTEQEMFDAIPDVIRDIESYDTTTVRASIGNWLLGKYISTHSEAKVIFNGDGSDELFGGYLYMNKCPDSIEFDKECRRLLKDIHLYDVLRSDKSISSHGLEPRTPFLDKGLVNYVLSLPPYYRNHNNTGSIEKHILRDSFKDYGLLPDSIMLRKKEAFSDGISGQGHRSLYHIIQEMIDPDNPSLDSEKFYYKNIFNKLYPNCDHLVPYFWMPKYTNASDPSARTLDFYY